MKQHSVTAKVLAVALVLSLQSLFMPVSADDQTASVSGTVLSSGTHEPLPGAKLYAADPKSGELFPSTTTGADGSFTVEGLPPSTYELAVESDGNLYLVGAPLTLAPGQTQNVNVAINPQGAASPEEQEKEKHRGGTGIWNNPLTAALVIAGAAIVLGVIINEATKDDSADRDTSPSRLP